MDALRSDGYHEAQLRRFLPVIHRLGRISLAGKKLRVLGEENFVRGGPSILIGNHCGSYKDVAVLYRIAPRPIFFNANHLIFTRAGFNFLVRKHLYRHMGRLGLFLNFILNPYKFLFVDYISSNIAKIGAIPVDFFGAKDEAVVRCEEYLRLGRAIVSLQGRGRVDPKERNPYIKPFGRGVAYIAYQMRERENVDIPVTPLALYGTQLPWLIPGTVTINLGPPMHIRDYWGGGVDATVDRFRNALQEAVAALFMRNLRP